MSMETNLHGRLRNTSLPYSRGLMPLFDAVVNSIHSIEEAVLSPASGNIAVEILRSTQNQFDFKVEKSREPDTREDIVGFKITDNGIGFDDVNMKSFNTLDTEHKVDKGCRGVGRLLWLKAFKRVAVNSIYKDGDVFKSRAFIFDETRGVYVKENGKTPSGETRATCVHLDGFEKKYREASRKTTNAIANSLFEHCLWYFVRQGGAPKIIVKDDTDSIHLEQVYEDHMHSSAER